MADVVVQDERAERRFDLLQVPVLGALLRVKRGRRLLQVLLLAMAVVMILDGFLGPRLAPRNLATLLSWVHFRGILVLVLLVAGNFFCMACPFTLSRDLARRLFRPALNWPKALRNKWLAVGLFVAVLFAYELFDLWGDPVWTASLILAYFLGAVVVDSVFKNASFCKYVCPIGQFNFVASTASPLEVRVHDSEVCRSCKTLDCIRGRRSTEDSSLVLQRGCELALFQPKKEGNLDCTFCLDCVHACPHDNVAITTRLPGSELWSDARRSGIGRLSRRSDLAVLALLFVFGGWINAFAMVHPAHALQGWMGGLLGIQSHGVTLGLLFAVALVLIPALLLCGAAGVTRGSAGTDEPLLAVVTRYAYAFIPLGVGIWLAHYAFHLLTGLWTVVPVTQQALRDLGLSWIGEPNWMLTGLPEEYVAPLEVGFLLLGWVVSLVVAYRIAEREQPGVSAGAFRPWAVLLTLLLIVSIWTMMQPMAMRGAMMGM